MIQFKPENVFAEFARHIVFRKKHNAKKITDLNKIYIVTFQSFLHMLYVRNKHLNKYNKTRRVVYY